MALVQPADMAVKANEILARFRPIAPKPPSAMPTQQPIGGAGAGTSRVLSHLQARPYRARKRGRPSVAPPVPPPPHAAAARRKRTAVVPYPAPPLGCAAPTDAVVSTAMRAGSACLSLAPASAGNLTRLSTEMPAPEEDDNRDVPVERDLLRKLLEPKVISPRAVRPLGSTVHILEPVCAVAGTNNDNTYAASSKTAQEVEAALEADALPALVSDSSNRVRLVNDAYKKMVGAPECAWLSALAAAAASRRISGEVALVVPAAAMMPESQNGGFSCAAKIEWELRGGERASVHAACDVTRLHCEARDYLFAWRLRTADDASPSSVSHRADK
ncbi:uncharacterized protein LOC100841082 [Brachypodium distachyon]|uniref:DUF7950 domain-containing protein n=1 Tax=Brachypodium distachyon TaxID=15368 RepID=I1GSX1_BRADI|nr:uncharacterized protein LOC100841082 [Brachypodium distachyon]KQK15487.1 hypothetical protein BRADI_1g23180v3 [Brachypodium distachyon]|eukprot:XP_003560029.1 uncharacterized protein LOC100841082 [Brachypodium distachyon]